MPVSDGAFELECNRVDLGHCERGHAHSDGQRNDNRKFKEHVVGVGLARVEIRSIIRDHDILGLDDPLKSADAQHLSESQRNAIWPAIKIPVYNDVVKSECVDKRDGERVISKREPIGEPTLHRFSVAVSKPGIDEDAERLEHAYRKRNTRDGYNNVEQDGHDDAVAVGEQLRVDNTVRVGADERDLGLDAVGQLHSERDACSESDGLTHNIAKCVCERECDGRVNTDTGRLRDSQHLLDGEQDIVGWHERHLSRHFVADCVTLAEHQSDGDAVCDERKRERLPDFDTKCNGHRDWHAVGNIGRLAIGTRQRDGCEHGCRDAFGQSDCERVGRGHAVKRQVAERKRHADRQRGEQRVAYCDCERERVRQRYAVDGIHAEPVRKYDSQCDCNVVDNC